MCSNCSLCVYWALICQDSHKYGVVYNCLHRENETGEYIRSQRQAFLLFVNVHPKLSVSVPCIFRGFLATTLASGLVHLR